jgi:uncharacterized protein (DUF1684 family)
MSELTEFRARKDEFFKHSPNTPLTPEQRRSFTGLVYFPENPVLRIVTKLERYADPKLVPMTTSTGDVAEFLRVGRIHFTVDDQQQELQVYQDPAGGDLFLPFTDVTTGVETYGAGRYVELEELAHDRLVLDFNYAYNPYCAYNEYWRCPIPPRENRLSARIEAGEKKFKED